MKLDGRGALITGGGSGIGAEIARVFVNEGAHVARVDRDEDAVAAVADELGDAAVAYPLDVTDEEALVGAIDDAAKRFGGPPKELVAYCKCCEIFTTHFHLSDTSHRHI